MTLYLFVTFGIGCMLVGFGLGLAAARLYLSA